jgi:hypothetical protein
VGQRAFQRGDMPATVNLLGRASGLPTPGWSWPRRCRSSASPCSGRRGGGGERPSRPRS